MVLAATKLTNELFNGGFRPPINLNFVVILAIFRWFLIWPPIKIVFLVMLN
jgi:hypothetical protein